MRAGGCVYVCVCVSVRVSVSVCECECERVCVCAGKAGKAARASGLLVSLFKLLQGNETTTHTENLFPSQIETPAPWSRSLGRFSTCVRIFVGGSSTHLAVFDHSWRA